jgi:crooked neck
MTLFVGVVVQITSEQIVREAKQLQEKDFQAPTQHITNEAELGEYRLRKRKEWEDVLRMKRWNLSIWAKVSAPLL